MLNPKSNQDLVKRINLLLDNELSKDDERLLLNEIQSNPSYRDLLQRERSFREFIKSRIHRKTVSPSLIQSIKDNLKVVA